MGLVGSFVQCPDTRGIRMRARGRQTDIRPHPREDAARSDTRTERNERAKVKSGDRTLPPNSQNRLLYKKDFL